MTRAPKYEVPTSFREVPVEMVLGFVRARPLCTLVANLPGGGVHAGHLPVVLVRRGDGSLALRGHVSRANAGWRGLEGEAQAVAILAEQEAYAVSEAAREEAAAARGAEPFAAVHLYGRMRIVEDPAFAARNVQALTANHAAGRAHPWNTDDTAPEVVEHLVRATVGVEFLIERAEACYPVGAAPSGQPGEIVIGDPSASGRCPGSSI